jgi:hypothetical protein
MVDRLGWMVLHPVRNITSAEPKGIAATSWPVRSTAQLRASAIGRSGGIACVRSALRYIADDDPELIEPLPAAEG